MADSDLDHAADDIRWIGQRLKGLMSAADALKDLGSIRNAIAEKTAINDQLAKQIDAHKATIADLEAQIGGLNSQHKVASGKLEAVQKAHQRTTELLGGVLKQMAPQG